MGLLDSLHLFGDLIVSYYHNAQNICEKVTDLGFRPTSLAPEHSVTLGACCYVWNLIKHRLFRVLPCLQTCISIGYVILVLIKK